MTTYHFIKEELSKSEVSVKPFIRTKKGKLERVKGHTRHVVLGEPFAATLEEQSEWVKKHKKILEDIKYAFKHGDLNEIESRKEIKDKFNMSDKEASSYIEKWKLEEYLKKPPAELREEVRQKLIQGQGYEKTIQELISKDLANEQGAVKIVNEWQEDFINRITDKLQGDDVQQSKQDLNNKISLLPESLNALEQSKINALYDIQQGLLKGLYDTYAAVHRVSDITGWWLEANTLLVMTWLADAGKPTGIGIGAPPVPEVTFKEPEGDELHFKKVGEEWEKIHKETILGISNSTLKKWALLTDFQKKEIEKIKKQFFYYKINKTSALSQLAFVTKIGMVGEHQEIEDLGKIVEEWAKDKYKYSKEKAKYSKKGKVIGSIPPYQEYKKENKKKFDVLKQELKEAKASGLLPSESEGYEEPEYLKPEKPKPPESKFQPSPNEEFLAENEKAKLQGFIPGKVSQTLLPENLGSLGGGKLGTNPGGLYKDSTTNRKYYIKAYADKQGVNSGATQARVEWLSNKIYQHLGIATPLTELIYMSDFGKLCVASEWIDDSKKVPAIEQEHSKDVINGFVADAYLKNWDVAGQDYDNIIKSPVTGQLIRSDNGGSMVYRAQGSAKEFEPDKISELETMKDPKHGAGKIFKGVTKEDILSQAQYLVSTLKDSDIDRLVEESGLAGTIKEKVINGLKGRRQVLISSYALTVPAEEQTVFALYTGNNSDAGGFASIGEKHTAVKGKLVSFPGFEDIQFFQYKNATGEYGIAELTTGLAATGTFKTEQQAYDKAKEVLAKYGYNATKEQVNKMEKAPQVPNESQIKISTLPHYNLPSGHLLKTDGWIKFGHANPHNNYKVTKIYANNKLHVEESDAWGNKVVEYDMTITDDIITTTEPKFKDKTPPPSPDVNEKVLGMITDVWHKSQEIGNLTEKAAIPKLKLFNKTLATVFKTTPYVFRGVSNTNFEKSMHQILNEHVLTGSNHVKGTTCMSVSPWSSVGFGEYIFVLDKKRLVENADWVKPIQYYNYELQKQEPHTFSQNKSTEHEDIYTSSYLNEMEVRARHIHDPLSVISEIWIHKGSGSLEKPLSEADKWKLIEEVENKYPQLIGKVRVLNIYKDLKWPKGMAKSIRLYLEGLKW